MSVLAVHVEHRYADVRRANERVASDYRSHEGVVHPRRIRRPLKNLERRAHHNVAEFVGLEPILNFPQPRDLLASGVRHAGRWQLVKLLLVRLITAGRRRRCGLGLGHLHPEERLCFTNTRHRKRYSSSWAWFPVTRVHAHGARQAFDHVGIRRHVSNTV